MNLSDINVQPGKRGLILGTTESGKSTLADYLIDDWVTTWNNTLTLIIDTKPHYKAQFFLDGLPTYWLMKYRAMRKGTLIPWSFLLPRGYGTTPSELRMAYSLARTKTPSNRGTVIIAQGTPMEHNWLNQVVLTFYRLASQYYWLYIYVDEMMVFLHNRANQSGVYQIVVSGAELGIGFLGASQRPRWIPVECISEMGKLYLFMMYFKEDMKHLKDMGVPEDFEIPMDWWVFHYFEKHEREDKMMTLDL